MLTAPRVLLGVAVVAHVLWTATYDGPLGDTFGLVFYVSLAGAALLALHRRRRRSS